MSLQARPGGATDSVTSFIFREYRDPLKCGLWHIFGDLLFGNYCDCDDHPNEIGRPLDAAEILKHERANFQR
jgi:hypothetical protein